MTMITVSQMKKRNTKKDRARSSGHLTPTRTLGFELGTAVSFFSEYLGQSAKCKHYKKKRKKTDDDGYLTMLNNK